MYGEHSSNPSTVPTGPETEPGHVLRAGSWYNKPCNCRSAVRNVNQPVNRSNNVGFRAAR